MLSLGTKMYYQEEDVDEIKSGTVYKNCSFHDIDFETCKMEDCTFIECSFYGCYFHLAMLKTILFTRCTFSSVRWRMCSLKNIKFKNCRIKNGYFCMADCEDMVFDGTVFDGIWAANIETLRESQITVLSNCVYTQGGATATEVERSKSAFFNALHGKKEVTKCC